MNDAQLLTAREQRQRAELDDFAAQERSTPAAQRSQYLAPIGPDKPKDFNPPGALSRGASAVGSAVNAGILRGSEVAKQGFTDIGAGLLQAASPVRQATDPLGEWTARMRGIKRTVDGLFGVLFSTPTAVTGAIGAGIDQLNPAALDAPLLDPYLSGAIRSMMGQADPKDSRITNRSMTGREILDLVGGALFLGAMHGGKPGEAPGRAESAGPRALPSGGAEPLALPGSSGPRALKPANPREVPIPGGPSNLLEMTPGERWTLLETLDHEGKYARLQEAVTASRAAQAEAATTPTKRGSSGEPTPTIAGAPSVEPGSLVDPTGRPVQAEPSTLSPREDARIRNRTPLSAEEAQADRVRRLYGPELAEVGQATETAVEAALAEPAVKAELIGDGKSPVLNDLGMESGAVTPDTIATLSRMALGALVGGSTGDTTEERVRNALAGMGLGAVLSRRVATAAVKAVSNPKVLETLRDESGVIRIPNFRVIETSEKVKAFMREMVQDEAIQKELSDQARGVRSHGETEKAGLKLIRAGKMSVRRILDLEPGDTLNAEEATGARMLTIASANRAVRIAEDVQAGRARLADLDAAIALSGRMTVNTHAVMSEQGRALNALGMTVSGDVPLRVSPERLAEEAAKMPRDERLPQMVLDLAKEHGPEAVSRFARWRQAVPDALLEVYYGVSLLSNPLTDLRNIVGNSMAVANAIAARQLGEVVSLVKVGKDPNVPHVALGESGQMALAALSTWQDAFRIAVTSAREGTNVTKLDIPMREPAMTAERLGIDPSTPWGAGLDYLGKYARFNLKKLEGEDTFFKVLNFNMERAALAYRQAEFEGLQGDAHAGRVASLLREPPEWMLAQAWDFAKEQTFSKEFTGRMKSLQDALSHPLLKVTMLPFFRTPMRLAEYAAVETPVLNLVVQQSRADLAAGGARQEIALGKLGVGAGIVTAVGWATLQGSITGNPPKDTNERKRQEEAGVKWKSIVKNGRYYSYDNLEPISSVVAVAADAVTMLKRAPATDSLSTELGQVATAAVMSAVRNLASKQYLESVGHFLEAVQAPDTNAALKTLQRQLASWVPAIVGQASRLVDPTVRETETLMDEVTKKLRVVGLGGDLAPRRNLITGEPMQGATFYTNASTDPVLQEIARLQGAGIRNPMAAIGGRRPSTAPIPMQEPRADEGIPLNAHDYDQMLQYMTSDQAGGQTLHERLGALIGSAHYQRQSDGVDGGKALALRQTVDAYKHAARSKMEAEHGDLIRARYQRIRERLAPTDQLTDTLGR